MTLAQIATLKQNFNLVEGVGKKRDSVFLFYTSEN